jgi:hypothetical protein
MGYNTEEMLVNPLYQFRVRGLELGVGGEGQNSKGKGQN